MLHFCFAFMLKSTVLYSVIYIYTHTLYYIYIILTINHFFTAFKVIIFPSANWIWVFLPVPASTKCPKCFTVVVRLCNYLYFLGVHRALRTFHNNNKDYNNYYINIVMNIVSGRWEPTSAIMTKMVTNNIVGRLDKKIKLTVRLHGVETSTAPVLCIISLFLWFIFFIQRLNTS